MTKKCPLFTLNRCKGTIRTKSGDVICTYCIRSLGIRQVCALVVKEFEKTGSDDIYQRIFEGYEKGLEKLENKDTSNEILDIMNNKISEIEKSCKSFDSISDKLHNVAKDHVNRARLLSARFNQVKDFENKYVELLEKKVDEMTTRKRRINELEEILETNVEKKSKFQEMIGML